MKITSLNNDLIKETAKLQQRKFRDESGLFLLEGEKGVKEALACGIELTQLFVLENYDEFYKYNPTEVTEAVMSKISDTKTPPKVVAVGKQPKLEWKNDYKKVVLLEDIKDAGNLGTILRTSCAFDVDALILFGDTVDLFNPKCVRASVGNLWKIPVFNIKNFDELKNKFKTFERIATLPKGENVVNLNDYTPQEKVLIMFGTESSGLSEQLKSYATKNVTIEMSDKVESLNLSISAGVILYKLLISDIKIA
jgi:TrmH family RNA methyltransferase